MDDFQPGYPIDLRSDGMRMRDARRFEGDFEYMAARVVARLTGERVVIQDDNSVQGMADVRIEYADRPTAFLEIVSDVDPARSSVEELRQLDGLGVVRVCSRLPQPDEEPKILLYPQGVGGPAEQDWPALITWLADFLSATDRADVRKKLKGTGAVERHVFVGLPLGKEWSAFHSLHDQYGGLPDHPPVLPPEVTHVWVWAQPFGRCIAWFPDRGWFDPRRHWATA